MSRALELTTGTVPDLAKEVRASRNSPHARATGRRNPTPENRAKLAEALRRRGGKLARLADELEAHQA